MPQAPDEKVAAKPSLKEDVTSELRAWSAELADIGREIAKTPHAADEEASGYEDHAEKVAALADRLDRAAVAEFHGHTGTIEIHVTEYEGFSHDGFRYEAYCAPPWRTTGYGGVVGYSDDSQKAAAEDLREVLLDLGFAGPFAAHDSAGNELPLAPGTTPAAGIAGPS